MNKRDPQPMTKDESKAAEQVRRTREKLTALAAMQALRDCVKFADVLSESYKRKSVALLATCDELDGRPYIPADVVAARFDEDAEMLEEFSLMIGEALGCLDARFPWKAFEEDARRER
jgi:hypothetical protein